MLDNTLFTPREWGIIYCALQRHFHAYGELCETLKDIDKEYLDTVADIIAVIRQQF